MARMATLMILGALVLSGQADRNRLGLPNPPKPDIPYLIHGSDIRELEQVDASEELAKNQLRYWIDGPAASVARRWLRRSSCSIRRALILGT